MPGEHPIVVFALAGLLFYHWIGHQHGDAALSRHIDPRISARLRPRVVAFDAVASTQYGSQHWSGDAPISRSRLIASRSWQTDTMRSSPDLPRLLSRTGCDPHGLNLLRFSISRHGAAAAGTLLMVFPLYGAFLTGLVLDC